MSDIWSLDQYQEDPEFWMHVCVGKFRSEIAAAMEADPDLTQRELGDRLGLSEARVSKLLHGSPNLTVKTMCQLAGILGKMLEIKVVERASLAEPESVQCSTLPSISGIRFFQKTDFPSATFHEIQASEWVTDSRPTFTHSEESSDARIIVKREQGLHEIAA